MYCPMVDVFPPVIGYWPIDSFVSKFGRSTDWIEINKKFIVWEPLNKVIFGNSLSVLEVGPRACLFGNNVFFELRKKCSCS
jgi:hypothetical protein